MSFLIFVVGGSVVVVLVVASVVDETLASVDSVVVCVHGGFFQYVRFGVVCLV